MIKRKQFSPFYFLPINLFGNNEIIISCIHIGRAYFSAKSQNPVVASIIYFKSTKNILDGCDVAQHGLSQQGIWVSFWTPRPLKSISQDTFFVGNFLKVNLKHIIEFFHLHIIPMTLYEEIMPYFDNLFIHVYD